MRMMAFGFEQERLVRQDRELADSRIASMMSQIHDYFIFNSFGAISGYCKIDLEKADAYLKTESKPGEGTRATIRIPAWAENEK